MAEKSFGFIVINYSSLVVETLLFNSKHARAAYCVITVYFHAH